MTGLELWAFRLHVGLGVVALGVGAGAMLTRKGELTHRRLGKVYVATMAGATATGAILAYFLNSVFLLLGAGFTAYLTFSGYRTVRPRRKGFFRAIPDLAAGAIALVTAFGLVGQFAQAWHRGAHDFVMVTGLLALMLAALGVADLSDALRPRTRSRNWLASHMGRMLGSYVSAVTAISVVQLGHMPLIVRWLWPSAIGVPLILLWIRKRRAVPAPVRTRPTGTGGALRMDATGDSKL